MPNKNLGDWIAEVEELKRSLAAERERAEKAEHELEQLSIWADGLSEQGVMLAEQMQRADAAEAKLNELAEYARMMRVACGCWCHKDPQPEYDSHRDYFETHKYGCHPKIEALEADAEEVNNV